MDKPDYTTIEKERKRGRHLGPAECGTIKTLKSKAMGYEP